MNWSNLKRNLCPKCDEDFTKGIEIETIPTQLDTMLRHVCGFQIRESRMTQIVNSQITQDLQDKWDNELKGGEKNE
jgi:hypothetical protein